MDTDTEANAIFSTTLVFGMFVTMVVAIVGSIGNMLTVVAILYQFKLPPRLRQVTKMTADTVLIITLCLADFFYSAISLPVMFVIYKNIYRNVEETIEDRYQAIPNSTCKWYAFIRYTNAITEWTTLGIMALERCITIYRFQRKMTPSRLFTPCRTVSYCVIVVALGMAAQTLTLIEKYGAFGYNVLTLKCDFMPTGNRTYVITPRVFFFALESAVPCFCIFFGYVIILTQVYSSGRLFTGNDSLTQLAIRSMAIRRSKTTKLIVKLLTVYLLCVIPLCVYNVILSEEQLGDTFYQIIGIYIYCLYWMQYCVNNFVYVLSNEKYREAYKQLFSIVFCRNIELPNRFKHLKNPQCYGTNTIPKPRIRTPSEAFLDTYCTLKAEYMSKSESKMELTFSATEIDFQSSCTDIDFQPSNSFKEPPIIVLPSEIEDKLNATERLKQHFKKVGFNSTKKNPKYNSKEKLNVEEFYERSVNLSVIYEETEKMHRKTSETSSSM